MYGEPRRLVEDLDVDATNVATNEIDALDHAFETSAESGGGELAVVGSREETFNRAVVLPFTEIAAAGVPFDGHRQRQTLAHLPLGEEAGEAGGIRSRIRAILAAVVSHEGARDKSRHVTKAPLSGWSSTRNTVGRSLFNPLNRTCVCVEHVRAFLSRTVW